MVVSILCGCQETSTAQCFKYSYLWLCYEYLIPVRDFDTWFQYLIPTNTYYLTPIPDFWYLIPDTWYMYRISGIRYQVSGIRYQISGIGTQYQVVGIRYQVLESGIESKYWNRVRGSGIEITWMIRYWNQVLKSVLQKGCAVDISHKLGDHLKIDTAT